VGDLLLDHPPFYELARFEDTFALGGSKGVRGVPGQRYYGKVKVFGNLEARYRLFSFHMLGKLLRFGVATFFDAGRLWADTSSHPELDGTSFGLKFGAGGGLRLQQDKTFVVRLDLAWSPDARPIGGYFGVGELF
jgi:hemolysin activation/secretion protein